MDALHYIRGVAPMVALPYEGLILAVLKGRHQAHCEQRRTSQKQVMGGQCGKSRL